MPDTFFGVGGIEEEMMMTGGRTDLPTAPCTYGGTNLHGTTME